MNAQGFAADEGRGARIGVAAEDRAQREYLIYRRPAATLNCFSTSERCRSGLTGTPGKREYSNRVSGVRIPPSPPVLNFRVFGDDRPRTRKADVQHGIGFRAERPEDFPRGRDGGHVRRKDRDERGLGFLDGGKEAGLLRIFRSLEGRTCGRAAARPDGHAGRIARRAFRTRRGLSRFERGLRRESLPLSRFLLQNRRRKNQDARCAVLAARDLATSPLAGGTTKGRNL